MDPSVRLRPAVVEDVPVIVDIYTNYVKTTVSTYAEELPVLNEFITKYYDAQKVGLPWLVAVTTSIITPVPTSGSSSDHNPTTVNSAELSDSTLTLASPVSTLSVTSSSSSSTTGTVTSTYPSSSSSSEYIVGYAYTSFFRPRSGWRFTVENSIYLRNGYYRKGIGTALVTELINQCEKNGFRQMIAVITVDTKTGDGLPSVQLHKQLGFTDAGMLKNVGFKFGRWLDCAFLQKDIGEGASTLPI